jgi:hypothetical protein
LTISRRTLVQAGQVATVAGILSASSRRTSAAAAQSTPVASPNSEPLPPEEVFQALLASEVTTPLFPADAGSLGIVEWVDSSDTDLDGTIGGLLVQDMEKGNDDAALIGACIVHPTSAMAVARLTNPEVIDSGTRPIDILGRQGMWQQSGDGSSLLAVVQGTVIVSAIGIPAEGRGPDQPNQTATGETDNRALANLAGLLDHLRMVLEPAGE